MPTFLSPCRNGHPDCFAYRADKGGVCQALAVTTFGESDCPFFATREQAESARAKSVARLRDIGHPELINYYRYKTGKSRR